jgi:uncharacterized membrane protein
MLALALAYPLLVHAAILWPHAWLEWLALAVLGALPLYRALRKPRLWAWCAWALFLAACGLVVAAGRSHWLLFIPPVVIPLTLLVVFAGSLRRGRVPMVTHVATIVRGPLPPDLAHYTRGVTLMWCVVFAILTACAVAFAVFATLETWSLFTNFGCYLLIGAVFVGEYVFRRLRFRHHSHPGFVEYVRRIAPVRFR